MEQATADQEAAIAAYGQNLLQAFEEVETSLTNEALFGERQTLLESSEGNYRKAYEMARDRFDVGEVTRTDVAQAEARRSEALATLATAQAQPNAG